MILKFLRIAALTILVGFVGLVGTIVCLLRPFHPDNARIFGRILGRPGMFLLGLRFRIENLKTLNEVRPCIVVSNHQHNLDIFPCASVLPKRTVSLGKKSIRRIPLFGTFYWLSGNVLIDRAHKRRAYQTMDKAVEAVKHKDTSIWMMPEGTRNRKGGVAPFKKGVFYAAIKAQCPVIPVSFNRYSDHLDFTKWRSGEMLATVHDPISTVGMTEDDIDALALQCHTIIANECARLTELALLKA